MSSLVPCDARLRRTAGRLPDAPALRWQDRTVTWAELAARVAGGAAGLRADGVGPGDRVAVVLGNVPAFAEAWYAVLSAGAVAVPVAPVLAPDELRHVLADAGAVAAVVAPEVAAALEGLRGELPDLALLVVAGRGGPEHLPTWQQLRDGGDAPVEPTHGLDDLAALVYTSGTTGRPRGAMLSHRNLVVNQDQSLAGRHRVVEGDVVLGVLPLFHVYGLNVVLGPAVAVGACVVLQERFDPEATATLVADEGVTVLPGAPPMYVAWSQAPPGDRLAGVRVCVSGAAPLPPRVAALFEQATGHVVREGYGLTEAGPSVTSSALGQDVRPGSVGLPLPGVELRLVERGRDVEPGDPGEVWVRGENVFGGYWNDPEGTAAALTDDGWLRTGDVGVRDDDGWLRLVDRRTDLVLVSGFNVYPREVERVLREHPAVLDAAVVGVPNPLTGAAVLAHVVRAPGTDPTEDELVAHCAVRLARYKCPSSVRVLDELPRTVTGKVRKTELRAAWSA